MSRPRFLADHDLNEQIIDGVLRREPSIHFVPVRELGLQERADREVLAYAASEGLVVVSHDVNTMPAAAERRNQSREHMAGLVMVAQRLPVGRAIDDLVLIWAATDDSEWRHQTVFLPLSR